MRNLGLGTAAWAVVIAGLPPVSSNLYAASCGSLAGKTLGDATILAAGDVNPPFGVKDEDQGKTITASVPFCRVQGTIKPTADSDIRFELWLPQSSGWNGKYEGVGNGGFAGSISFGPMTWGLQAGYAVSGTDTGHVADVADASWARGHPEKLADWGWRAIHETTLTSKAIVQIYYGQPPAHAYFTGCSNGGREALMEAQRFPADYDGIVAGTPTHDWIKMFAGFIWDQQRLLAEPGGAITAKKLPAITAAVQKACHGHDGILDDPGECHFDSSMLLCKAAESDSCLTAPQVTTLKKIYSGMQNAAGERLLPGIAPGGEADPDAGWGLWITGTGPKPDQGPLLLTFGRNFFADMIFGKSDWDFRSMNFDSDLKFAQSKAAQAIQATETDLGPFKTRGGKLIQYHGWYDPVIPAAASIQYYEAVAAKMGGVPQIQSFYRLFMAPGMQHCADGPGPNAVSGQFGLPAPSHDADHDVVAALAHWVENGVAPARIIATKYRDNDPSKGVAMQRPWCPYPAVAHYSGRGSRSEASSFTCDGPVVGSPH